MSAGSEPQRPPTATIRALETQMTPALRSALQKYAEGRVKRMCLAGRPVSTTHARELVDDAYADTRIGVLLWDPERCDLVAHLKHAIKQRTWRELRHARGRSSVALHEAANDRGMVLQIEDALARSRGMAYQRDALAAVLSSACQWLRRLVYHEPEITVLTRGWEEGLVDQDEILESTGLSRPGYARARKRALYMSRHLPAELREAVRTLLRAS